jgi:hypothetical protein
MTHTYVLAVLGDDVAAIQTLKPILQAMPQMVLVGTAPVTGHKERMAAFIQL